MSHFWEIWLNSASKLKKRRRPAARKEAGKKEKGGEGRREEREGRREVRMEGRKAGRLTGWPNWVYSPSTTKQTKQENYKLSSIHLTQSSFDGLLISKSE